MSASLVAAEGESGHAGDARALCLAADPRFLSEHFGRLARWWTLSQLPSAVPGAVAVRALYAARALEAKRVVSTAEHDHQESDARGDDCLEATLCVEHVQSAFPLLRTLLAHCKSALGLAGRWLVNAYLSAEDRGFGWHFDAQHVFVLQVEGSKSWRHTDRPAIADPSENCLLGEVGAYQARLGRDVLLPDALPLEERVLRPGDVLYLPPGAWHATRASGRSFSLTFTFVPLRFSRLAPMLPAKSTTCGPSRDALAQMFAEAGLPHDDPAVDSAHLRWIAATVADTPCVRRPVPATLQGDLRLRPTGNHVPRALITGDADWLHLWGGPEHAVLPGAVLTPLAEALGRPTFVGDLLQLASLVGASERDVLSLVALLLRWGALGAEAAPSDSP